MGGVTGPERIQGAVAFHISDSGLVWRVALEPVTLRYRVL